MKAYPTVDDLPEDIRAYLSPDAQEVYRAAYNISYAYNGRDPFVATPEAYKAARSAKYARTTVVGFILYALVTGLLQWVWSGASGNGLLPSLLLGTLIVANLFGIPRVAAKWQRYRWTRREAELLDANGNPTMPGAVPFVPQPSPSSGGTESVNPSHNLR